MTSDRSEAAPSTVPPPDARIAVVGERLAGAVARRLSADVERVSLLTDDERAVGRAGDAVDVVRRAPTERAALRATVADADVVVIAAADDGRGLLLSRLAALAGGDPVFTLVEDPENLAPFRDADVTPVCVSSAVAATMTERFGTGR